MGRVACRWLIVVATLAAGAPGTARLASANDVPPAVVALVVDTSGSVSEAGLERSRELSLELLARLPAASELALLTFDDESHVVVPLTVRGDEVRAALAGLRLSGNRTALHDAVFDAGRQIAHAAGRRRAIVLVTDGRDTGSALEIEDGLRLANDAGIPVFAIGVGRARERLLRRIAKLTGGEYVRAGHAAGATVAQRIAALEPAPRSLIARPAQSRDGGDRAGGGRPEFTSGVPLDTAEAADAATAPAAPAPMEAKASAVRAPAPAENDEVTWLGLGLAVLVPVAGIALVVLRRRSRPRCPTCGRPRAAGGECPDCPPHDRVVDADLSPTVLARLSATEEYLDKTVTLRERPVLAVTRGPALGQTYDLSLQSATSLGRAKVNDIVLSDVAVSSEHCRVRPEDGRFVLHDLKSTNGTYVNERRVTRPCSLSVGDVIKIGETSLQFRTEQRRA